MFLQVRYFFRTNSSNLLRVHQLSSIGLRQTMSSDISGMRKPYKGVQDVFLVEDLVSQEPFGNFKHWFDMACNTDGIHEANAMSLATATKDGKPSVRVVLLKGFDKNGFRFFTNYESRKARELNENPHASVVFYWEPLHKSIRIEGTVKRLTEEESTKYFNSRPKASQIGACVSQQSTVIESRKVLEDKQAELEEKYKDAECIPKPDYWGGYCLKPELFEFWQGQTNRVHDRLVFTRRSSADDADSADSWTITRLAP